MWNRSTIQDTLQRIEKPRPGDVLLVARPMLERCDPLGKKCVTTFFETELSNASFIVTELQHYCDAGTQS